MFILQMTIKFNRQAPTFNIDFYELPSNPINRATNPLYILSQKSYICQHSACVAVYGYKHLLKDSTKNVYTEYTIFISKYDSILNIS